MIKNRRKLNRFYRKLLEEEKISYRKALFIYEQLYREAVSLGAITADNILDGLEVDIRIARTLNSLSQ